MIPFFTQLLLFYIALFAVLFLPGYLFIKLINVKVGFFTKLEEIILAMGFSIFFINSLMLILSALHVKIGRWSLIIPIIIFSALFHYLKIVSSKGKIHHHPVRDFHFSKKQLVLTCLILGLSIFIKTIYLKDTILPSATDMGHHMYWTNDIVLKGAIPNYEQRNVLTNQATYQVSKPQSISDFIVGEHLIFAAISLISGLSVISYFPTLTLFLINIFSILAILILTLRMFEQHKENINISIFTLLLLGPIFAITPPQAKFVSGGVVGNIIGNLLLPLALYFFLRAIRSQNSILLTFALVFSMSLFYTHHLTALIFAIALLLAAFFVLIFNFKNLLPILKRWKKIFLSKPTLLFLLFSAVFALLIYTPTYITNNAIKTVVGAPKKIEHTGLTITQFKDALGEPRLVLALCGILILSYLIFRKTKSDEQVFSYEKIPFHVFILAGWIGIIAIISLYPQLIKMGIPSGRVANYGTYPFSIVGAFFIAFFFLQMPRKNGTDLLIKPAFFLSTFILFFLYIGISGFSDNGENLNQTTTPQKINQTFNASEFLAKNVSATDQVQSDHIYIKADSWIKIFFMKDYNFPLYRANLERYENGIDRNEKCTLNMISSPKTPDSLKCFSDLNVKYVMVSKKNDAVQFQKNSSFWQIYSNDEINVFYKAF